MTFLSSPAGEDSWGNPDAKITLSNYGNVIAEGITVTRMADARVLTLTPIVDAVDKIKGLSPGREGFLAADIGAVEPEAVFGEENAVTPIGTYTDLDGNVETEVDEPEAIPYGATWQQTGTREDYQSADATKLIPLLTKALQEVLRKEDTKLDLQP